MESINRKNPPVIQAITSFNIPKSEVGFLDNNIPYRIFAGGTQEIVYIHLNFNAGSIYSNQKLLANITSKMLLSGTNKHTAQQIADTIDFYGAEIRANCQNDYASIGLLCLNKYLDILLPLLCEIITDCTFPADELKITIANNKHKWIEDHENTKYLAQEKLLKLAFNNHPYSRTANLDDYDKITSQQICDFYVKHYNASNCKVVVAGNVTTDVVKLINSTIGKIPVKEPISTPIYAINDTASTSPSIILKENAVQSSLRMGFSTITMEHPDYAKLHILLTVLGGYFGSRLMTNIREEKGYTYGIYAQLQPRKQAGLLRIAGDIKAGYALTVVDEIKKEMQRLKDEPISADELYRVQNYMIGDLMQQFDGPLLSLFAMINALAIDVDASYFTNLQENIQNANAKELQEIANKYFDLNRLVIAIAGKE